MGRKMKVDKRVEYGAKKVGRSTRKFFSDFKEFISRGNMMDLAVGVIIGAAVKDLVSGFVKDIFTPIINCIGSAKGEDAIRQMTIPLGDSGQSIMIGDLISDIISFVIMAFVVFLIVRSVKKISEISFRKKIEEEPTTKICPFCKSEIDIEAVRCPHCTSILEEIDEEKDNNSL